MITKAACTVQVGDVVRVDSQGVKVVAVTNSAFHTWLHLSTGVVLVCDKMDAMAVYSEGKA